MKNISTLFYDEAGGESLLSAISLKKRQKGKLLTARQKIRHRLEDRLPGILDEKVRESGIGSISPFPKPRFFTQGSFASNTVNDPCRKPPQQADLDDGLYLPYSTVGDAPPAEMSKILFDAVADVLGEMAKLAQHEGWELDTGNGNCVRMILAEDMHIDVPIYSIPDEEFAGLEDSNDAALMKLVEDNSSFVALKSRIESGVSLESYNILDSAYDSLGEDLYIEFMERYGESLEIEALEAWENMPTDKVLMASRDSGWQSKDPRPILDWFSDRIQVKGSQLLRIVRYLKAWRDYQIWPQDDPKSILLMVAAEKAFAGTYFNNGTGSAERDDLALLAVLKEMPNILKGELLNPSMEDEEEDLAKKLDKKGIRYDVIARLEKFAHDLEMALSQNGHPDESIRLVRNHIGDRFPDKPRKVLDATVEGFDNNNRLLGLGAAAVAQPAYPKGSVIHA